MLRAATNRDYKGSGISDLRLRLQGIRSWGFGILGLQTFLDVGCSQTAGGVHGNPQNTNTKIRNGLGLIGLRDVSR